MIIKASQRSGTANLAAHLCRTDENEHVSIAEMRGFVSDDLHGAFKEIEAVSRGTRCKQPLFSVSFSPPASSNLTQSQFVDAIDRVESACGLEGQPRAIVFHEKEGRRHAHAVWSRIDAETMTAKQLSFFKTKCRDVARSLCIEHGYKMPDGLTNTRDRDPRNFTLAEWQKSQRRGEDPRWLKDAVQDAKATSDSPKAFEAALNARGLFLAKGDRRGHVVIDHHGDVHSLSRTLGGKAKDMRAFMGAHSVLGVDQTRNLIAERMTPAIRQHVQSARSAFQKDAAKLGHYKMEMAHLHRGERADQITKQSEEWNRETTARQARIPRGFKGLWSFVTGKTAGIMRANALESAAMKERQADEREALIARQLEERRLVQDRIKELRERQAAQLWDLRRDLGRYLRMSASSRPPQQTARKSGLGLKLER